MIFSNVRKELPVAQRLRGQNHFNASPNKYKNKSNYARNIDRESVSIRKLLRWVLLASEHAPASPTCTASPLARTSPFTATLQNSRCRERITFPIRKFFRSDVESIESVGAVGAVLHNIGCTRHSLSKLNSALVGTIFRGGLLPIRQVFRRLCLCGSRCDRGSCRLPSDSGETLSFCDSARKSLIS